MPSQRDIVLVPVPFTDLSSSRRRPVVIISNNEYNRSTDDIVVVAMTSNPESTKYSFTLTSVDLESGKLNRPGKVRADKIYTLSKRIILNSFGRVNVATLDRIRQIIVDLCRS